MMSMHSVLLGESGARTSAGPEWPTLTIFFLSIAAIAFGVAAAYMFFRNVGKVGGNWRESVRECLAIAIVGVGILIVGVLGIFAMLVAEDDQFRDKVVSAIFPLLGAWVGAVIAYYFAKENLEAATKSTKALLNLDERLRQTTVSEIMIDFSEIDGKVEVADEQAAEALKVSELQQDMPRNRAPVVDGPGRPMFVVHKGTLAEYISGKVAEGQATPADLTLGDLKNDNGTWAKTLWDKLKAFATVGPKATLADVKEAMRSKGKDCADVFVTQDGTPDTPIVGWVTNVDLGRASRA